MRRQGYEFAVSRPKVILHRDDQGRTTEPIEELTIDVPQEYSGVVIEKLGQRKGVMVDMQPQGEGQRAPALPDPGPRADGGTAPSC